MNAPLLGGIGLTHLSVYQDQAGPDGVHAGCAHIHALTPEAYFGVSGEGAIELHDLQTGFRRLPISKGTFIQFQPGTLHRSVSTNHLEVLAIMGNGGLAERGDARIYFGKDVDANPDAYERLRGLGQTGIQGAMARRDVSALAYRNLMALWHGDPAAYFAELKRFMTVHNRAIADKVEAFKSAIDAGPVAVGERALAALAGLQTEIGPTPSHVAGADVQGIEVTLGMCGRLRQIEQLKTL